MMNEPVSWSPTAVTTLLVAAIVLPILLFPFGAVILANIIFAYGYCEYKNRKTMYIYGKFIDIAFYTNVIFLILILLFDFEILYDFLNKLSIFRFFLNEKLPLNFDLTIFKFIVYYYIFVLNPYFLHTYRESTIAVFDFNPRMWIRQYRPEAGYYLMPMVVVILVILQLSYFYGYNIDLSGYRGRGFRRYFRVSGQTFQVILFFMSITLFFIFGVIHKVASEDRNRRF